MWGEWECNMETKKERDQEGVHAVTKEGQKGSGERKKKRRKKRGKCTVGQKEGGGVLWDRIVGTNKGGAGVLICALRKKKLGCSTMQHQIQI